MRNIQLHEWKEDKNGDAKVKDLQLNGINKKKMARTYGIITAQ